MMRKMLIALLLFCSLAAASTGGKILEDLSMPSNIMPNEVKYCVYLPPDYDSSENRHYPVVYLLHGYGDNEWGWTQFGEIKEAVDAAIAARQVPPMIIIMPDGLTTYYINNVGNTEPWADMFVQEFIPHVENKFRIRSEQRYRGIAGLSMGGFGTLHLAMRFPELFSACAAFSAAVRTDDQIRALPPERLQTRFKKLFGEFDADGNTPENWQKYSPLWLLKTQNIEDLKKVRYYIDCGDDDFLTEGNCIFHLEMQKLGIPHQFRVRDGQHSWVYWRTGIIDGLTFISSSFIK